MLGPGRLNPAAELLDHCCRTDAQSEFASKVSGCLFQPYSPIEPAETVQARDVQDVLGLVAVEDRCPFVGPYVAHRIHGETLVRLSGIFQPLEWIVHDVDNGRESVPGHVESVPVVDLRSTVHYHASSCDDSVGNLVGKIPSERGIRKQVDVHGNPVFQVAFRKRGSTAEIESRADLRNGGNPLEYGVL